MKKVKRLFAALISALLLCTPFLVACGPLADPAEPKEKTGTTKSFTLDLVTATTAEITVADYIDENGADGVTYSAALASGAAVTVSPIAVGKLTVTAAAAGTSTVALRASQGGSDKV